MRAFGVAVASSLIFVMACGSSESTSTSPGGGSSATGTPSQNTLTGPSVSLGQAQQGIATFYDADGTGNCSFDKQTSGEILVVAPNKDKHFDGSAICGGCLKVTGAKGSVVVRVTDSCPTDSGGNDCGDTGADLDLSAAAFAKIDDPSKGKINVTFELVECDVQGPMEYRFKDGSSEYWTAIQVLNHKVPVAKLEYQFEGAFVAMQRADYNYFIEERGVGKTPNGLLLRITSDNGQVVTETIPGVADGKTVTGTQQFD